MNSSTLKAIQRSEDLVRKAEDLIFARGEVPPSERTNALMALWSLTFEFHRAILQLLRSELHGAAFALMRPIVETTVRTFEVVGGSPKSLKQIKDGTYRTNFGTVGAKIDKAFSTGTLFSSFLGRSKDALHGYTHGGMHQMSRRITDEGLKPNYTDSEIVEVVRVATSAVFLVNIVTTKCIGFEDEWRATNELLREWDSG